VAKKQNPRFVSTKATNCEKHQKFAVENRSENITAYRTIRESNEDKKTEGRWPRIT
jgi:hypothetical protein